MVPTFVDSALQEISRLKRHRGFTEYFDEAQIQVVEFHLGLLKMFLHCLINVNLSSMVSSLEDLWDNSGESLYAAGVLAIREKKLEDWNMVLSKLEEKTELCEQQIKKYGMHLISYSFQCQYSPSDQILEFLNEFLYYLEHLYLPGENKIESLKEKLLLLRNLIDFAAGRCTDVKDLGDFVIHVHSWVNKAACLTYLYWVNEAEDEERLNLGLTDLLQKVNPCTPEFTGICFAVMISTKFSRDHTFLFGEFVSSFVDFLLQNLPVALKDEIEILREGLIFLTSFLADPPTSSAEDYPLTLTRNKIVDVLGEASHLICFFDEREEDLGRNMTTLLHFGRKIQYISGQIEKHYVQIPHFNFPRTNGLGFVEHLLGNIEDLTMMMNGNPKLVPFAKHQIFRVKEELMSLSQSNQVIWEQQKEHKELKDLLAQITNVAYQAETAVNSSFVIDHPIWYHLACLSCVLGDIKDVRYKFEKFKSNQDYGSGLVASVLPSVYMPSDLGSKGTVVGFHDETEVLIDRITRGTAHLDIVPIVGMGGLGKTTLARKLYNEPLVRCHFIVQAFCNVGQQHCSRSMLLEILKGFISIDDGIRAMTTDDLAHRLYKCLKGRRYLIIMDDIWDVRAWKGVKDAFTDDNNGSRVVFTTRISSVALIANSDCRPHYLRFFSMGESWELLQEKVFHKDPCPPDLRKVGMLIAKKCNGLPLAVVVIAGVLARVPRSLSSWNRIADDLTCYASSEGCKEILEYSYKHLPEALKSCLLYFGAFVNDRNISAKRLMMLWNAEGFVPKSERNSFLSMAKQYLNDLVIRSLVIVDSRSSTGGGIKSCHVHDLIRDLCVTIAQEEQFLHHINRGSRPLMYGQYRICIHAEWSAFVGAEARGPTVHSLLYFPMYRSTEFCDTQFPYNYFKLLQLLDIQETHVSTDQFPEEVTMLVHLRYLAFAIWGINYVPPTIAKLRNLETFVLRPGDSVCKLCLPNTIWKMKRLRHVDVGCNAEVRLDKDIGKESSQLADVESFSSVTIADGLEGEEILRRLPNARKLSCVFDPSWDGDKRSDRMPKMDHLTMLESLNIVSTGVRYPCVFSFPSILKKLSLSRFRLPWSEFSTLAKLPYLEVLKLSRNAFEGERWDVEEEFSKLKFLKLGSLDVVEWIASFDSFPCLERLNVSMCRNLMEIPACFAEVPTLKAIEVYKCKETAEESAIQIQNEQLEMGNQSLEILITKIIRLSLNQT